jgi:hypothetical protein
MHTTDQSGGETLERERERLFASAYGMLGVTAEAEDVVQEAFARWYQADRSTVRSPAAFLTTVATRLAIDRLRSSDAEIAETVAREEANCRQIGRRARARLGEPLRRVNGDPGFETETAAGRWGVVGFELAEGLIVGIRIVVNPDKLRHLARANTPPGRPQARRLSARLAGFVERYLLEHNQRVRVKIGRSWRTGTAHILPDDDPFARLDTVASALGRMRRLDAAIFRFFVRRLGTQPVTMRIDLDPPGR